MKVAATLTMLPAVRAERQEAVSWRMSVRKLTNSGPLGRLLALKEIDTARALRRGASRKLRRRGPTPWSA
jgi:hypothetical protein